MTALRVYLTAAISLMGLAVGYLAQRSRMCFVAGFRDWLLVRDGELLAGFFSFFVTVWVLTSALYSLGLLKRGAPEFGEPRASATAVVTRTGGGTGGGKPADARTPAEDAAGGAAENGARAPGRAIPVRILSAPFSFDRFLVLSLAGGWMVGLLSTFAGGCVLRQHVLAAQGSGDAAWYLAGFYAAVPVFYLLLERFFHGFY